MPIKERPISTEARIQQLSARVEALERRVGAGASNGVSTRWWEDGAGRFANDPAFDEIVRLGRQQRNAGRRRAKVKQRARS